jgi:hypothetical protein
VNIFAVNNDPALAARDLPDKLVVKMPTESLQLLTPWAFNTHGVKIEKPGQGELFDSNKKYYGVKGFAHHPCAKWLYESPANVVWLWIHAYEMTKEYQRRYGREHGVVFALHQLDAVLSKHYDVETIHWSDRTDFPQAMPEEFKIAGDPVTAYRNYINGYKGYAEWNYSEKPDWWDETKHEPVRKKYLAEREEKRLRRKNDKYPRVPPTV